MSSYFVRTNGNDTTGDGSTGLPWLTLAKAMTVAVAGDTVNVGDGTYAENNANTCWTIAANLASDLTIQSESGIAANVIIVGSAGASNTIFSGSASAHIYFKNLTFGMRSGSSYALRFNANCSSLTFDGCIIDAGANASAIGGIVHLSSSAVVGTTTFLNCITTTSASGSWVAAVHIAPTSTGTFSATFTTCTIAGHARFAGSGASGAFVGCTITGNIAASALSLVAGGTVSVSGGSISASNGSAINANGATSIIVSSCLLSNTSAHGTAIFGADSTTGNATAGSITGCLIQRSTALAGHGLLIGAGCSSFVADSVTIPAAYDYGLVVKECAGAIVRYCHVAAGVGASVHAALYCKAATGVNAHHNKLIAAKNATSYCMQVLKGDTNNKAGTVTLTDNQLIIRGTALAFNWGGSADDSGGGVCDRNRYDCGASFGNVYGTSTITTLAALKTAWATYDVTTNDAMSRRAVRPTVEAL